MSIKDQIKAASKKRRVATFVSGELSVELAVEVYTAAEFNELSKRFGGAPDAENAKFLAGQFFDPETGEPVFSEADIMELSMPMTVDLLRFFSAVNSGTLEKKI